MGYEAAHCDVCMCMWARGAGGGAGRGAAAAPAGARWRGGARALFGPREIPYEYQVLSYRL